MTETEHLLVVLAEECAEVQQNIAKALRFGLDDHHPDSIKTNRRLIMEELSDLFGTYEMLKEKGIIPVLSDELIKSKKERVEQWFQYSIKNNSKK